MTPTLAASKPIWLMNSFLTGTHSDAPWRTPRRAAGRKRRRSCLPGTDLRGAASGPVSTGTVASLIVMVMSN